MRRRTMRSGKSAQFDKEILADSGADAEDPGMKGAADRGLLLHFGADAFGMKFNLQEAAGEQKPCLRSSYQLARVPRILLSLLQFLRDILQAPDYFRHAFLPV